MRLSTSLIIATLLCPAFAPAAMASENFDSPPHDLPRVFSLDDCIRLALENNRRIKGMGFEIEAAKGQLTEASAAFWPVLEHTWRIAPVPTDVDHAFRKFFDGQVTLFTSLHIGVGIPVTAFGQLRTVKKMAMGGVEAARLNEEKTKETTIYQVKQLYWGVLLAKETIKLIEDAVEKISNKVKDEEAKEEKELDPYDILQLKVTRVDLERRLDEARVNMELAYEGLRMQMDLEPGAEIRLDTNSLRPVAFKLGKEQDYVDNAMSSQPETRLLDIGVDTKRHQYRLEKFKLAPQAGIGFFTDIGRTTGFVRGVTATGDYNDPFNYTRAGVGLQFKGTLDFHGSYGRIKKARAEYYKAAYDRLFARRALSIDIQRAYLAVKRTHEDVQRAKKAESIAQQMTFLSKMNLDVGIGDSQRYGDALKLLLLTRGLYFKAVFDYNVALADLEQRILKGTNNDTME